MLGIAIFGGLAFGLGLLYPLRPAPDHDVIGLRFALGAALLILALYVLTVVLRLALRPAALVIAGLALAGWCVGAVRADRGAVVRALAHPAFLLPLLALGAVAMNGGVGYRPYLIDEFTNWIGVSRVIHWAGSYDAVRTAVYLPGYTPGWRLLLLLPWQFTGDIELGLSAAAPLVLHVAVLALVYDLAVAALRREAGLSAVAIRACAWIFLLLFLTAEAMGRLWTYEMLIEQPQIYLLSAVTLIVLKSDLEPGRRLTLYAAAGLVLAAAYLLKSAALAAIPAAAVLALLPLSTAPAASRVGDAVLAGLALLGPILLAAISWSMAAPQDTCLASPLTALEAGIPASYDLLDLARRLALAVAGYAGGYKPLVGVMAVLGVAAGLRLGLYRAPLFWFAFTGVYFAALYWYHLTCFGDYYYTELNSIPRFTRVPLQVFHALGLVLLLLAAARLRGWQAAAKLRAAVDRPWAVVALGIVAIGLAVWQARQVHRTVVDLTTRADQHVDPRIAEMSAAAGFVARHFQAPRPRPPSLAVLDQGEDGDVRGYAQFFALQPAAGGSRLLFETYPGSSWAPVPGNLWQSAATPQRLAETLGAMDVLWPIRVDAWLRSVLAGLVANPGCLDALPEVALLREADAARFRCIAKDS